MQCAVCRFATTGSASRMGGETSLPDRVHIVRLTCRVTSIVDLGVRHTGGNPRHNPSFPHHHSSPRRGALATKDKADSRDNRRRGGVYRRSRDRVSLCTFSGNVASEIENEEADRNCTIYLLRSPLTQPHVSSATVSALLRSSRWCVNEGAAVIGLYWMVFADTLGGRVVLATTSSISKRVQRVLLWQILQ